MAEHFRACYTSMPAGQAGSMSAGDPQSLGTETEWASAFIRRIPILTGDLTDLLFPVIGISDLCHAPGSPSPLVIQQVYLCALSPYQNRSPTIME